MEKFEFYDKDCLISYNHSLYMNFITANVTYYDIYTAATLSV
jgi:hypothetical protein